MQVWHRDTSPVPCHRCDTVTQVWHSDEGALYTHDSAARRLRQGSRIGRHTSSSPRRSSSRCTGSAPQRSLEGAGEGRQGREG